MWHCRSLPWSASNQVLLPHAFVCQTHGTCCLFLLCCCQQANPLAAGGYSFVNWLPAVLEVLQLLRSCYDLARQQPAPEWMPAEAAGQQQLAAAAAAAADDMEEAAPAIDIAEVSAHHLSTVRQLALLLQMPLYVHSTPATCNMAPAETGCKDAFKLH
jgi:hypothetical protein